MRKFPPRETGKAGGLKESQACNNGGTRGGLFFDGFALFQCFQHALSNSAARVKGDGLAVRENRIF